MLRFVSIGTIRQRLSLQDNIEEFIRYIGQSMPNLEFVLSEIVFITEDHFWMNCLRGQTNSRTW